MRTQAVTLGKETEAQIKALESSDSKLRAAIQSLRAGRGVTTGADGARYSDEIYTGDLIASGPTVQYISRGHAIYRRVTGPDGELFSHRRI